ncbi:MAG: hypothetical protein ACI9OJ_000738 [Myxococcota bacterium]|jgi:hypothetical protein
MQWAHGRSTPNSWVCDRSRASNEREANRNLELAAATHYPAQMRAQTPRRDTHTLFSVTVAIALLVTNSAAAQDQGIVLILVGDAPQPPGLIFTETNPLLEALGLRMTPKLAEESELKQSLASFDGARSAFYDGGSVETSIRLGREARGALTRAPLDAEHRKLVTEGLWLLVHALLNSGSDDRVEAAKVMAHAWGIDPIAKPDATAFSPRVMELWTGQQDRMSRQGARLTVTTPRSQRCEIWVDGQLRGLAGKSIVVPIGERQILARCGDRMSFVNRVRVADGRTSKAIAGWQFDVRLDAGRFQARERRAATTLTAVILAKANVSSVLVVSGDAVRMNVRLTNRNSAVKTASLTPTQVADFVNGASSAANVAGAKPWHYALMGLGVLVVAAGGATHAMGAEAVSETEDGVRDRRSEFTGFEAAYGTLYAVGGATILTATILVIVAETMPISPVVLSPTANGFQLVGTF